MLKRPPELHDAPKLEDELARLPKLGDELATAPKPGDELATGTAGLRKDNLPSFSLVSDSRDFEAAWDPSADLFSPLEELAFSQFTTSLNLSCN